LIFRAIASRVRVVVAYTIALLLSRTAQAGFLCTDGVTLG
jgi:hypothetical protein